MGKTRRFKLETGRAPVDQGIRGYCRGQSADMTRQNPLSGQGHQRQILFWSSSGPRGGCLARNWGSPSGCISDFESELPALATISNGRAAGEAPHIGDKSLGSDGR